jgi:hypothetical protein
MTYVVELSTYGTSHRLQELAALWQFQLLSCLGWVIELYCCRISLEMADLEHSQ